MPKSPTASWIRLTSGADTDDAFTAEALRVARESRSTHAAVYALDIGPKHIYYA